MKVDGVAQTSREDVLIRAVGIHDSERSPYGLFFLAGVAGRADGDVEVGGTVHLRKGDGAGEMPAAVLVAETVVRVGGEGLGWGGRMVVARIVTKADQLICQCGIEPGLGWFAGPRGLGVEGEVIGIAKVFEIGNDPGEGVCAGIPAVENVKCALAVVTAVEEISDEDAVIGGDGEEARAVQAGGGDLDGQIRRQSERNLLLPGEVERVRNQMLRRKCRREEQDKKSRETHSSILARERRQLQGMGLESVAGVWPRPSLGEDGCGLLISGG